MQKHQSILTLFLAVAISAALAACSGITYTPGTAGTPGTPGYPPSGGMPPLPGSDQTSAVTAAPIGPVDQTQSLTPTVALTQPAPGATGAPATEAIDPGRVTNLMKFGVWNINNENIGNVADMIINLQNLQLDYVVVSAVDHDVAVPWQALKVVTNSPGNPNTNSSQPNGFVLTVDQAVFDNAPAIQLDKIPAVGASAAGWDTDIRSYWERVLGTQGAETPTPAASPTPAAAVQTGLTGVIRVSELLSYKIEAGGNLANLSVDDVLINVESGTVQYVVIHVNSPVSGDVLIPIPLQIFSWDSTAQAIKLTVDVKVIQNAPTIQMGKYPDTQTPGWDADIQSYWQNNRPSQ